MTRIGVIADVHANRPALDAVLKSLKRFRVDRLLCCGDLVGCGPWPEETIDRLREEEILCVRGNHDDAVLHFARYRSRGNETNFRMLSWTHDRLSPDQRRYLAKLPDRHTEREIVVVHGGLRSPLLEFVVDPQTARENFPLLDRSIGLVGHSHLQGGFVRSGSIVSTLPAVEHPVPLNPRCQYLINPGSVGMPRDGDPRAAYAILDQDRRTLTYARASYDAESVRRRMQALGFDKLCSPERGEGL